MYVGLSGGEIPDLTKFQAPSESQIRQKYGVGADVATLGLSLYVLGFSFGPFLCTCQPLQTPRALNLFLPGGKTVAILDCPLPKP